MEAGAYGDMHLEGGEGPESLSHWAAEMSPQACSTSVFQPRLIQGWQLFDGCLFAAGLRSRDWCEQEDAEDSKEDQDLGRLQLPTCAADRVFVSCQSMEPRAESAELAVQVSAFEATMAHA